MALCGTVPATLKEDSTLILEQRRQALTAAGLLHPHPDLVGARLFAGDNAFFLALDKVQVKYEMPRASSHVGWRDPRRPHRPPGERGLLPGERGVHRTRHAGSGR